MKQYLIIILNALIVIATTLAMLHYFQPKDGKSGLEHGLSTFRYFTIESNVFSAAVSALVLVFVLNGQKQPQWLMVLHYVATVTVLVTCLTVMFYLGPTYGFKNQLSEENIHMHLMGPVMAFATTCFLENDNTLTMVQIFLPLIPVGLYGLMYIVNVGKRKKWEDFYGFARTNLSISGAIMMILTALICLLTGWVYNL